MADDEKLHIIELAGTLSTFADACALAAAAPGQRGEFEHMREARTAFLLLRGHSQALNLLVAGGRQLYPSGWPVARAMLEVGVRSAWRMNLDDPYEAEARWAHYESRYGRDLAKTGGTELAAESGERASAYAEFCDEIADLLTARGTEVPAGQKEPSMPEVMRSLGLEHRYNLYAEASERQHGNHLGLEAWTANLGDARKYGEFASWLDWVPVLATARGGLLVLAKVFRVRTETKSFDHVITEEQAAWGTATSWLMLRPEEQLN
jgi:hypothetical protein